MALKKIDIRCDNCNKLLFVLKRVMDISGIEIKCSRCKKITEFKLSLG